MDIQLKISIRALRYSLPYTIIREYRHKHEATFRRQVITAGTQGGNRRNGVDLFAPIGTPTVT